MTRSRLNTWLSRYGFMPVIFRVTFLSLMVSTLTAPPVGMAAEEMVGNAHKAIGEFFVVRTDGIEERLEGTGSIPLYEGDVLKTGTASQALVKFSDGVEVALNEETRLIILSRWEIDKGFTRVLRLGQGEIWMKAGSNPIDIETPVASAWAKQTEFNLNVQPNGQTTLTVVEGVVDFGTAFGTCPISASTISYGNRGKKCTKPQHTNVSPSIAWTQGIR